MKIALLGYGKMGKEIEEAATNVGHRIILKINSRNANSLTPEQLKTADVAIEFSNPSSVLNNICLCIDAGVPVVVGTTGWYSNMEEIKNTCVQKNGSVLFASNFSIGVNLFFELNELLTVLMKGNFAYKPSITETHHTQKLDKPSGTAITLANQIVKNRALLKGWSLEDEPGKLKINAVRKDAITGTHTVTFASDIDKIEITHEAFNRKGFAQGAVLAAQWLQSKKGFFEMRDVIHEMIS